MSVFHQIMNSIASVNFMPALLSVTMLRAQRSMKLVYIITYFKSSYRCWFLVIPIIPYTLDKPKNIQGALGLG